jgi:hypothetical protein
VSINTPATEYGRGSLLLRIFNCWINNQRAGTKKCLRVQVNRGMLLQKGGAHLPPTRKPLAPDYFLLMINPDLTNA